MHTPTVQEIFSWLDGLAPFATAEGFDNVGLLLGDKGREVSKVFFCLDANLSNVEEAAAFGADLIVTHHPLIFRPLRRIDYTAPAGQALCRMVSTGMALISAHTNWDKAPGGVSDALAEKLELTNVAPLDDFARMGHLPRPMTAAELKDHITSKLDMEPRMYCASDKPIRKVAVAGGSYGEGAGAAYEQGAEAYITGEIGYHDILDLNGLGLTLYQAGHFATERPGIAALYQRFLEAASLAGWQTEARLSTRVPFDGTPV